MWWWPVLAEVDPRSVPSLWDCCKTRSEAVDEDGARRPPPPTGMRVTPMMRVLGGLVAWARGGGQAAPRAWSEMGVETLSLSLGFWLPVVLTVGRDHSIVFSFLLPLRSQLITPLKGPVFSLAFFFFFLH